MITTYAYIFGSVLLVSLVSFIGVFSLALKEDVLKKYIGFFISLAVGALLGDAFIHIIPESISEASNTTSVSILIIAGIISFFTMEKFLHWHHHGEEDDVKEVHPVGKLVLVSDGVHNFIDGIIIGASFLVNIPLGIATTLAVILHEIPQEIGDFAVLIHAGFAKRKALWLNFASALLAILGAVLVIFLGSFAQSSIDWLLPFASGGFIYIAVADLIPELHKQNQNGLRSSIGQIIALSIGVVAMVLLTFIE